MSEIDFEKRYDAATAKPDLTTAEGLKAAEAIFSQAEKEGVICAIAGGMAMHIYGFSRATHDVDLLASQNLDLPAEQKLSFGGLSHLVQVGERQVIVVVIVRDDFFRNFYEAALRDSHFIRGWRIVTPEWMAILKYLSGRSKDIIDLLWLLKESGLVDRAQVAKLLEEVMGETGAQVALRGLKTYYVQAEVMRGGDENGRQER
ncbi:MAG: hypothetical protein SF097_16315 [Acidobacteriota bacterium]|nr:hypothetical protein [Acidobacteriota bacterium]